MSVPRWSMVDIFVLAKMGIKDNIMYECITDFQERL
jgi:hypothetical protein